MTTKRKIMAAGAVALPAGFAAYKLYRIYQHNFLPRYSTNWAMKLHPTPPAEFKGQRLGYYYGDLSQCLHDFSFDEQGFIVSGSHKVFNPCQIAEYAIIRYESYLKTGEAPDRVAFKQHADWLVQHATTLDATRSCLYYHYDTPEEKAPWGSGIAQGMAISALLRAAQEFEDEKYARLARALFNQLDSPVEAGGFHFSDAQWKLWYEEDNHCGHILNGHIFALFGVYDLYRATGDVLYKTRFETGVQTIKDNIGAFDLGFHTKYSSVDHYPANNSYHFIHITLFEILFNLTGDEFFAQAAQRFCAYHEQTGHKLRAFACVVKLVLQDQLTARRTTRLSHAPATVSPDVKLETLTRCNFCSSAEHAPFDGADGWQIVRCEQCGLCFTNPRPTLESLPIFYTKAYFQNIDTNRFKFFNDDGTLKPGAAMNYANRIADIEAHVARRGSLLEVGAAMGSFLQVMRERGWQVAGVEISRDAVNLAREHGIELFCGVLEEFKTDEQFDAVCIYQTMEHVTDPCYTIERAHALLRPGGVLVIEVPNIESFDAKINAERKRLNYDLPRHLHHFTPSVLARKLEASGFEVVEEDFYYPNFILFLNGLLARIRRNATAADAGALSAAVSNSNGATSGGLPLLKKSNSRKMLLLRAVSRHFPGWRFTLVARKKAA